MIQQSQGVEGLGDFLRSSPVVLFLEQQGLREVSFCLAIACVPVTISAQALEQQRPFFQCQLEISNQSGAMLCLREIPLTFLLSIETHLWKNMVHQTYSLTGPLALLPFGKTINEHGLDDTMDTQGCRVSQMVDERVVMQVGQGFI